MLRKKKRDPIVVQANCLIGACVNLTLNEHKVLKYIISKVYNINDKNEGLKRYRFLISDMQREIDIDGNHVYTNTLKHLKGLRDKSFTIHDSVTNKNIYTSWILEFGYDYVDDLEDNRKYVEVLISDSLQPYLQNLGKLYSYTKYKLSDICNMTSTYSLILYEILLRELHGRGTKEWIIPLNEYRDLLGLLPKQYTNTTHLKTRVTSVAVEEINAYTELNVKFEYVKRGVKIVGVKFEVEDGPKSIRRKKVLPQK
jgi:plasmid replication initiation protein